MPDKGVFILEPGLPREAGYGRGAQITRPGSETTAAISPMRSEVVVAANTASGGACSSGSLNISCPGEDKRDSSCPKMEISLVEENKKIECLS